MIDNTFAGPHQNFFPEIDFYIHSLTKYVTGTGDTMGGVLLVPKKNFGKCALFLGSWSMSCPSLCPSCHDWLKTYLVRYRHAGKTAMSLSQRLRNHPHLSLLKTPKVSKGMEDPVPVFMIALKEVFLLQRNL